MSHKHDLRIPSPQNGYNLAATLNIPKRADGRACVLLLHGMTSSRQRYIDIGDRLAMLDKPIPSLALDLGGHGDSGGSCSKLTAWDVFRDVIAAYDFIVNQFDSGVKVGIFGTSFGGMLAAQISEIRLVKTLVLRAPAVYIDNIDIAIHGNKTMMNMTLDEIMADEKDIFRKVCRSPYFLKAPALQAVQKFAGNFLIIVSEKDAVIPSMITDTYFDLAENAANKNKVIIQDAPHFLDGIRREQFIREAVNHFATTM